MEVPTRIVTAVFIVLSSATALSQEAVTHDYQCEVAPETRHTVWGHIPLEFKLQKPRGRILGVAVTDISEGPLDDVLVEVFDHPELIAKGPGEQNRTGQHRLAACLTDKTGRFSFRLSPGDYELRLSKPDEWDSTSVYIKVRRGASSQALRIGLRISQ